MRRRTVLGGMMAGGTLAWLGAGDAPVTAEPIPEALHRRILEHAHAIASEAPRPLATPSTAGKVDPHDPHVLASEAAYQDADDTALLALAARLEHRPEWSAATANRLDAWAAVHRPSGHPIDETRLASLVVAHLETAAGAGARRAWLLRWREAAASHPFGPETSKNNHRTHHLKTRLLLAKALGDEADFAAQVASAAEHARTNIDSATGETYDFHQRRALYYQLYDLEPWLEVALLSGRFVDEVSSAYAFLAARVKSGNIDGEFVGSTEPLDALRGAAGYGYGAPGSRFDTSRIAAAVFSYHTIHPKIEPDPLIWSIAVDAPETSWRLYARARRECCRF